MNSLNKALSDLHAASTRFASVVQYMTGREDVDGCTPATDAERAAFDAFDAEITSAWAGIQAAIGMESGAEPATDTQAVDSPASAPDAAPLAAQLEA